MSAHGTTTRADKPLPWWRLDAPLSPNRLLVVDVLLLVPAIAGAVWKWPWGVTMALLIPGLSVSYVFGVSAARARGISRPRRPTMRMRLIWAGVLFAVYLLTESIRPRYVAPFLFVVLLILILVPISHAMWRRVNEPEARPQA
jgi:hypothetical protein